jgi:predicted nucleotidyltransferase
MHIYTPGERGVVPMDKANAIELVRKYSELVMACFPAEKIILYGSYAHGHPREDSDIDVAVQASVATRYDYNVA